MNQNEEQDRTEPSSGDDGKSSGQDNQYARHAQAAAAQAKAAAQDALSAARRLFVNPVAGIGTAHGSLGQQRILGVAIVFALVAAISLALAGGMLFRSMVGAFSGGLAIGGAGFHFGAFLKSLLVQLITIVAGGVAVWLLAPIFRGRASLPSGLFVAATAWLPLGLAALAASIIGSILSNRLGMILIGLLLVFGVCYLIQVLNAGIRHVAEVDERRAAVATPTVLSVALIVSWLAGWLFS